MNLRKPTITRIIFISSIVSICVAFILARISKSRESNKNYKFPVMSKDTWEALGTTPEPIEEEEEEDVEEEIMSPPEEELEGYTAF